MEKDYSDICHIELAEEKHNDTLWIKIEMQYLQSRSIPHLDKMELASLLEKCANGLRGKLPEGKFKISP